MNRKLERARERESVISQQISQEQRQRKRWRIDWKIEQKLFGKLAATRVERAGRRDKQAGSMTHWSILLLERWGSTATLCLVMTWHLQWSRSVIAQGESWLLSGKVLVDSHVYSVGFNHMATCGLSQDLVITCLTSPMHCVPCGHQWIWSKCRGLTYRFKCHQSCI